MKYSWCITKDYTDADCIHEPKEVEIVGPRDCKLNVYEITKAGLAFRLYDDDGNLYYSGRVIPDPDHEDSILGPLHDFGTPNAGAVEMKVYRNHRWETV